MHIKFEKRQWLIGLIALAVFASILLLNRVQAADEAQTAVTVISIDSSQPASAAKRLGINTGAHDQYGAAQILKNLIPNPGFESGEIGMIFQIEAGATGTRIQADNWDTTWNNYPLGIGHIPDYWNYGSYEILTGPAKGRTGTIADFTHDDNKYTFILNNDGTWPSTGDVVSVRKNLGGYEWNTQLYAKSDTSARPNSPGTQSLKLLPASQPSLNVYFDSYSSQDANAGKMLTVEGNWRMSFWAKAANAGDSLTVNFRRNGGTTFVNETFPLTADWQLITHDFSPQFGGDGYSPNPGTLILSFSVNGSSDIFIDDAELYRRDFINSTVFVDPYVDRLKQLRPGILRNWGAQLGSSLDNQLAEPWARKTTGHSPKFSVARDYHYSLHEFLELADAVGAEPWYVIPPTFTPVEMQNLMAYLSAPAGSHPYADKRANLGQSAPWTTRFNQIHLEYGNEIWGSNATGDPFIGATMRGGINAGQVANGRFSLMKASPYYQAGQFNFVIGGQTGYAGRQGELEANSSNHDSIGFGPYFGTLDQWNTDAERFQPLYAHAKETVQQGNMKDSESIIWNAGQGTQMSIYEINLHTVDGSAPVGTRDDVMTSLGGGIALPLTMLTYLRDMNIVNQAAFQSLQYSTQRGSDNVRGWGLLRDVQTTGWKRPTWLGLELANTAIGNGGAMLRTTQWGANPTWTQAAINGITAPIDVPYVQSFAFGEGLTRRVMLFNLHLTEDQTVQIYEPTQTFANATLHTLTSDNIHDSNEYSQKVAIQTNTINSFGNGYTLTLAPHSAYVLEWTLDLNLNNHVYIPIVIK